MLEGNSASNLISRSTLSAGPKFKKVTSLMAYLKRVVSVPMTVKGMICLLLSRSYVVLEGSISV